MGRESCEELSLGAIWKEKWGLLGNTGSCSEASLKTSCHSKAPRNLKHNIQQYWHHLQSTCETFLLLPNISLTAGNLLSWLYFLEFHQIQLHLWKISVLFLNLFFFQIQIPLRKWSFYSHSGGNLLITSCCIVVISYTKKKRGTFLLDWEEKVILEPGKLKWSVEAREQNSDSRNIVSRENFKSCFWSFRASSPGMILLARSNEKWWVLAAGLKS